MTKLGFLEEELKGLREQGLYNNIRTITGPQGSWFVVDGHRVLNLCSNNYLGFANTPELKEAAKKAGVTKDEEEFERAFKRVLEPRPKRQTSVRSKT